MWGKEKRGEKKVISLIYLWCNEGMLNASEHAVVVMLSGKMKCLHSRLSEEQRKEKRRKIRGGERRVAVLQRGVNHLISTAPSHSPQNGYFVPSDGRHEEEGVWTAAISSPTSEAHFSTSTISHIYGLPSHNILLSGFSPTLFHTKWNLLNLPHFLNLSLMFW